MNAVRLWVVALVALAGSVAQAQPGTDKFQPCQGFLAKCASENPAALKGYTVVEAAFDSIGVTGGRYELTLFSGNAYRFVTCRSDEVPNVVLALLDLDGNLLITNITPDGEGTYPTLELNCTATADYQLIIKPMKGSGCAGLVYGIK